MNTKRIPQLDKVAIQEPIPVDGLDVRKYKKRQYILKGLVIDSKDPVYRYAKNFALGDFAYCLILLTHESSAEAIEQRLQTLADNLTEEDKKHVRSGASTVKYVEGQ